MKKYSFLISMQWLKYLLITALFAVCCYFLGQWQYSRHLEKTHQIEIAQANYNQTPVPFADVQQDFQTMPEDATWKRFFVKGKYIAEGQKVARNRTVDQKAGFEVIVPFKAADGTTFLVDRGWIPLGKEDGKPDDIPPVPSGEIELIARLKPGETSISRDAPDGQVASINIAEYQKLVPYPLAPAAYGLMDTEVPSPEVKPQPLPAPDMDPGSHLSYTWQWYAFGLLAFTGLFYSARSQARIMDEDTEAASPSKKSSTPTDEDYEDAILDQLEKQRKTSEK